MRRGTAPAAFALAFAAGSAMARPTPLRGVVEGYYGRPWSDEARRDVIRAIGREGMNAFVYGPKNDPYHRDRWREWSARQTPSSGLALALTLDGAPVSLDPTGAFTVAMTRPSGGTLRLVLTAAAGDATAAVVP